MPKRLSELNPFRLLFTPILAVRLPSAFINFSCLVLYKPGLTRLPLKLYSATLLADTKASKTFYLVYSAFQLSKAQNYCMSQDSEGKG